MAGMKKFSLRDLFWFVLVVALATALVLERRRANHWSRESNHWNRESEGWQKLTERRDQHIDRMEKQLNDHGMSVGWNESGPRIYGRQGDRVEPISDRRFPPYDRSADQPWPSSD
jgi:hypothetical protein